MLSSAVWSASASAASAAAAAAAAGERFGGGAGAGGEAGVPGDCPALRCGNHRKRPRRPPSLVPGRSSPGEWGTAGGAPDDPSPKGGAGGAPDDPSPKGGAGGADDGNGASGGGEGCVSLLSMDRSVGTTLRESTVGRRPIIRGWGRTGQVDVAAAGQTNAWVTEPRKRTQHQRVVAIRWSSKRRLLLRRWRQGVAPSQPWVAARVIMRAP